jgi:hypothetical protein
VKLTWRRARELLDYEPATGFLRWKVNKGSMARKGGIVGSPHNVGYLQCSVDYQKYLVHRLIWFWVTGEWPQEIDHINRVKTDNRWENLRSTDRSTNCHNSGGHFDSVSGFKGVSRKRSRWRARIRRNGRDWALGSFATREEAAAAYAEAAR